MTDSERIARLEVLADQHTHMLTKIDQNVESLLLSRASAQGALKLVHFVVAGIAAVVSLLVSIASAWVRH